MNPNQPIGTLTPHQQAIVTLTLNPAVDKSSSVDQVMPERKLRCEVPRYDPGGGGLNVSRAITKLGGASTAVFPIGGTTGQLLCDLLAKEGVTYKPVNVAGWTRENLVIAEKLSGNQFRFGMPGPPMSPKEWEKCLIETLNFNPKPTYLVASGSLATGVPDDFYARVARGIRGTDIKLVVDTSGVALAHVAREKGIYLLKCNLRELKELTQAPVDDDEDLEAITSELIHQRVAQIILVTLGAQGVMLAFEGGPLRFLAPTVQVRSKVGAGDSTLAGMVLSLARGFPLDQACIYGVASGTAAVMSEGTGLCKKEDADRLYGKMMLRTGRTVEMMRPKLQDD